MTENKAKPELLAPAGSTDAFVAAVRCGADAVYLGGKQFSARKNARNFDRAELESAAAYARRCGVRIYVTVNTVLFDGETEEAARFVYDAACLGAHGFIVTDPGLIALLRTSCPQIVLHGSTQMAIHNPQGVAFAREAGLSRVVLAREMTLAQVREASGFGIETEVFVHGALCVCLSGQCYLSGQLGGRSGNRGLCAQPCRLPFALGDNPRALSLRDLSAIEMLPRLAEAGVRSLKIEGRMKRPEYVAAVVTGCRSMLDTGSLPEQQREIIQDVFSRSGFTNAYLEDQPGRELYGYRRYEDVISAQPRLAALHELYKRDRPSVPVDLTLKLTEDASVLTVGDGAESASVRGETPFVPEHPEYGARFDETAHTVLSRTGGTPFFAKTVTVDRPAGTALTAGAVGAMRREALEELAHLRERVAPLPPMGEFPAIEPVPRPETDRLPFWVRLERVEQADRLDLSRTAALIVPLEAWESSPARVRELSGRVTLYAEPPRVAFGEAAIRAERQMKAAFAQGQTRFYCENPWSIQTARELGAEYVCGHFCNLTNSRALEAYRLRGASAATVSTELDAAGAGALNGLPVGYVIFGRLPLMTYAKCPVRYQRGCASCGGTAELTDRTGAKFRILCRQRQYSCLLNNRPVWLAHRLKEFTGLSFGLLYFTDQTPEECARILRACERGDPPAGEFTYGCAFRRVQ